MFGIATVAAFEPLEGIRSIERPHRVVGLGEAAGTAVAFGASDDDVRDAAAGTESGGIGWPGSGLEAEGARLRAVLPSRASPAEQGTNLDRQELRLLELARKPGLRFATENSMLSYGRGGGEMALWDPAADSCMILDLT